MHNSKQLYRQNVFYLPKVKEIQYNPFKKKQQHEIKIQQSVLLNEEIEQIKPTYALAYNSQFEIVIGGQNMYPLFIDITDDHLIVSSKDFFLVIKIQISSNNNSINENNVSFLKSNVKLGIYNKIMLNQPPTCIKAKKNHLYIGLNSGKILCYDMIRKVLTGSCDDFSLPIMQIQVIADNKILAIDCAGNLRMVQFSHKTFMDKIIKTLISTKDLHIVYKTTKRQKIKKLVSNFITKKQQPPNNNEQKKSQNINQNQSHQNQNIPYHYTKITVPDQTLNQLLVNGSKLIAVAGKLALSIFTYNQNYEYLQEQIISQTTASDIGMLQFGVGAFQNSNVTHILLVFSVKNKLEYFKGVHAQDSFQWLYISSVVFPQKIVDGKFISNNLLIILTQKYVSICNVNQNPQIIHSFSLQKFSYIDFFIQQQGLSFDKNLIKKNIFKTLTNKNQFFCLQGKRLLTGKIDSWTNYLQRYVEEEKFNQTIVMGLKIYNRELRKLCGINQKLEIRNKEMKDFFEKITLTYISYEVKKQQYNKQRMLELCTYFLVKTQAFQYLFTTIFQIIKSLNLLQQFLQILQPYIQKGQIKQMPQQTLSLLINRYKQHNNKQKIQILVKNFDLNIMQKSILLIICLKQHLFQSMIHICIEHNDFISPILKLCGIVFTQQLREQQKIRIKQILFFYIKQCLLGHNTEYGNDKAYIEMLIQVINFIFIPSTLDMLVNISCSDTIKIINMFFEAKILQYILQNEGQFFIKRNDYVQLKIFQEKCINQFKVYQKMLSTLIFIMDQSVKKQGKVKSQGKQIKNEEKRQQLNEIQTRENNSNYRISEILDQDKQKATNIQKTKQNLISKLQYEIKKFINYLILKNQFPFISKYKLDSTLFFIQNAFQILSQNSQFPQKPQLQKQIQLNSYLIRLLDSLLRSLQQKPDQKIKNLNQIWGKISNTRNGKYFNESKCYLLHELGKYSEVMDIFMKMNNQKMKKRVFDYLQLNINLFGQLGANFIKNIDSLIKLDKPKTFQLLSSLKQQFSDHQKIIQNLKSYPQIQLSYIQKVLKYQSHYYEFRQNAQYQQILMNKLALYHLQIVVKHRFSQLDQYIQKIPYPLEEAYKICEQKGNITAKAYILIKSGRNMQGLMMLCDIFLKSCDQIFGILARKKQLQQQKKKNLDQQLKKLLETCYQQYTYDKQRGQLIWQKCSKKIFKHLRISQNMKNQAIPKPIKQILHDIVHSTMKKMFSQLDSNFFIQKFCKMFPNLPFRVFIIAFGQLFDRMQFNNTLQFLQIQLLQNDKNKSFINLLKCSYRAHPTRCYCAVCDQKVLKGSLSDYRVNTYSCSHVFHKTCMINEMRSLQKRLLKQGSCSKCMNEVDSFLQLNGNMVQLYQLDKPRQAQIKRKITKLKDYQCNQFTSLYQLPSIQIQIKR